MQEHYRRCKHCGTRYLYRINGRRWGKKDYVSDYCPECQEAIDRVIRALPRKFEPRDKEIDPSFLVEINSHFKRFPYMKERIKWDDGCNYSVYMDGNRYNVFCEEHKITCSYEYDLIKGRFTDSKWEYDESDNVEAYKPWPKAVEVIPMDIPEPTSILFYMDFLYPNEENLKEI